MVRAVKDVEVNVPRERNPDPGVGMRDKVFAVSNIHHHDERAGVRWESKPLAFQQSNGSLPANDTTRRSIYEATTSQTQRWYLRYDL